jgi:tetratricopeptide (TPR) repeat protein
VGRTFLNDGQYDISHELFQHIRGKLNPRNEYFYMALGNIAFSLNRKGLYSEALDYLLEIESFDGGKYFFAWHAVARAYSIYKLADNRKTDEYRKALENAKARSEYKLDLHKARRFYPEIVDDLN